MSRSRVAIPMAMQGRTAIAAPLLILLAVSSVTAQQYSLNFNRRSDRMTWTPTFPSWNFAVPVALSSAEDSTSMLRITASTSMTATLDQRSDRNTWQDNASVRTSINYPILGPRASIGISARASSRSFSLVKQKIRQQSINFRFNYRPLAHSEGVFRSLRANLTPGLITARTASRASLDSTIEEKGIQYNAALSVSPDWKVAGKKVNTSLSFGKTDNTLKNSKSRSENLRLSLGYTFPFKVGTSLSFSESRSQTGVTRAVISEELSVAEVVRDTVVAAELSERRSTRVSSSVNFKIAGFDIRSSQGWSEAVNTNTANADDDPRNRFFAKDLESETVNFDVKASGKVVSGLLANTNVAWSSSENKRLPVTLADGGEFRDPADDREDGSLYARGSLDWQVGDGRSIALSGSARMKRDDNPGAPDQDRDTFTRTASLSYKGKRESGLGYDIRVSSSATHRINLDASRSSNNSRSRDLGLDIQTRYERLEATISHSFEISARRTIFDFDRQINPSDIDRQSNIRRGWTMRHSVRRSFFQHLQLNGTYTFRADDLGTYVVDNGTQIVEEDNADHRIGTGMSYRPNRDTTFGMNYTYRIDRQWRYAYTSRGSERDLSRRDSTRNLSANFAYRPKSGTKLTTRASRSQQRSGTFDSFRVTISRQI